MPYRTVTRKSTGEDVRLLQKELDIKGFHAGPVDGVFGFLTERAVISFQRAMNIPVDGIVGPRTWSALLANELYGEIIEINMMSVNKYGGRGKATIDLLKGALKIVCWAMPVPSAFGKVNFTGDFYETYTVWLAYSEEEWIINAGYLTLEGLEYRFEKKDLREMDKYNLLLLTLEKGIGLEKPQGPLLMIGCI